MNPNDYSNHPLTPATRHTGWLHTLDPRSKLVLCFAGAVVVLTTLQLGVLLAMLAFACCLLLTTRLTLRGVFAIGWNLAPLVTLVLVTWPLFYARGDDVWFAWWFIRITRDGVLGGCLTTLRILSLVYVLALLAATTNPTQMVSALRHLRVPYAWALTISLSLRYIPTLYSLYRTVTEAQQARGWTASQGHLIARARGYLPILIAVLIGAIRLSDQTAMALMARGFDAQQPRILYRVVKFQTRDWWVAALSLAGLGAWAVWLR
jgi:energy-coupling factor transport system permease protein